MIGMAGVTIGPYQVTPRSELRIGTAEREQAARLLGQHLSAGRLELSEFDERVKAAYGARTERELAALFIDLPDSGPRDGRGRSGRRRKPRSPYLLALFAAAALAVVAVFAAFPPLFVLALVLLALRVRRLRSGPGRVSRAWSPARRA